MPEFLHPNSPSIGAEKLGLRSPLREKAMGSLLEPWKITGGDFLS